MCGIYGYSGTKNAPKVVVSGLKRLEYRGYDSAGVAFSNGGDLTVIKSSGRVKSLDHKIEQEISNCAIGHTRWATHGLPTEANAHPHRAGKFAIVHNGIIENYNDIKNELIASGSIFNSETDSEIIAHLYDTMYKGDLIEVTQKVVAKLSGAYAIGVMCTDYPDTLLAIAQDSPLILGRGTSGNYLSSDMNALQGLADEVMVLEDGEFSFLNDKEIKCYDLKGKEVFKKKIDISALRKSNDKANFDTHMLAEMNEIPTALSDTIDYYEKNGLSPELQADLSKITSVIIIACGTAYNAGCAGKYMIESKVGIPCTVQYASEFRYCSPVLSEQTLVIAVSQSGETADTIAAVRLARSKGVKVICIANVARSTLTRNADHIMLTYAGPEIAVAATKSYNCQVTVLAILASLWGQDKALFKQIKGLPMLARKCIIRCSSGELPYNVFNIAEKVFFIGRLLDYTTALEGSLKFKEITYIMSEGYAAGELKHGTLALIDKGTPVVTIITSRDIASKTLNAVHEVEARGARVLLISCFEDLIDNSNCESFLIPESHPLLMPVLSVIPLQFIAHEISRHRGCDPDRPRNLAKSVTVE